MNKKKWVQSLAAAVLLTGVAASGVPASQADTSQGSQTTTSAVDSTRRPVYRWQYLVTKPAVYSDWRYPVGVSLNGRTYLNSMTAVNAGSQWPPTVQEFILARKCKELRAVAGMADDTPAGIVYSLQVIKVPSQRIVFSRRVTLGQAIPMRLNMRGALRVRFETQSVEDPTYGMYGSIGVGTPRVLCRIR